VFTVNAVIIYILEALLLDIFLTKD